MFPSGKSRGVFPGKFGVLKFPVFREIYVAIPGNFFILVRVSVVVMSIIPTQKMRYCEFKLFLLTGTKYYFSKFVKIF